MKTSSAELYSRADTPESKCETAHWDGAALTDMSKQLAEETERHLPDVL